MSKTTTPAITLTDTLVVPVDATDTDLQAVVDVYRGADTKAKTAMRNGAQKALLKAVDDMDLTTAAFAKRVGAMLTTAPKSTVEALDPKDVLVDAVLELELAAFLIRTGATLPAGLDLPEGFDLSEVPFITDAYHDIAILIDMIGEKRASSAVAAAQVYAGNKRTRATDRNDIGAAILSAFEGLSTGAFLTVTEIANKSGAGTGAIEARLFPHTIDKATGTKVARQCTVEGITPGKRDGDTGPKGARLV